MTQAEMVPAPEGSPVGPSGLVVTGNDPVAAILANLKTNGAKPNTPPAKPAAAAAVPAPVVQVAPVAPVVVAPKAEASEEFTPEITGGIPAPIVEEDPAAGIPDEPEAATLSSNFKLLKGTYRKTREELSAARATAEKLERKVKDYEEGKLVPEVLAKTDAELNRLRSLEKIHSLKTSTEYQEKIVKPLNTKAQRAKELAAEYSIPAEQTDAFLREALNIKEEPKLNRFIMEHFDELAGREFKDLVTGIKGVNAQAKDMEAEPARHLEQMQQEQASLRAVQEGKRRELIKNTSRDAWVKTQNKIRAEGRIQELIMREGDTKHNEEVAGPLLTQAAKDYGFIVKRLADLGVSELPEDLASMLAEMASYTQASATAIWSRNNAVDRAEKVVENNKAMAGYARPAIGSSGSGVPKAAPAAAPKDTLTAVAEFTKSLVR